MKSVLVFIIGAAFGTQLPFKTTWKVEEELQGGAKVFYGKDGKEEQVEVLSIASNDEIAYAQIRRKPKRRLSSYYFEKKPESLYRRSYGARSSRNHRNSQPTKCFVAKIKVPVSKDDVSGEFTLRIGREESAASGTVFIRAPISKAAAKKRLWSETEPMCEDVKCLREQQGKCAKMLKEIVDDLAACQDKSCNSAELKQYVDFMARQCQKVVEGSVNAVAAFIEGAPDVQVTKKQKKEQEKQKKEEQKEAKEKSEQRTSKKQKISQDQENDEEKPARPQPQQSEDDDVLTPQKDGDRFEVSVNGKKKARTEEEEPEEEDDEDAYW